MLQASERFQQKHTISPSLGKQGPKEKLRRTPVKTNGAAPRETLTPAMTCQMYDQTHAFLREMFLPHGATLRNLLHHTCFWPESKKKAAVFFFTKKCLKMQSPTKKSTRNSLSRPAGTTNGVAAVQLARLHNKWCRKKRFPTMRLRGMLHSPGLTTGRARGGGRKSKNNKAKQKKGGPALLLSS